MRLEAAYLLSLGVALADVADSPPLVDCFLSLDVVILQDTTSSFYDDLPNMRKAIPDLFKQLMAQNPGSRVGLVEFKDKPYMNMGQSTDFCRRHVAALTDSAELIAGKYAQMEASGGVDYPEAIYHAALETITDAGMGWRPLSKVPDPTYQTAGARLLILSTDAPPHDPGDWQWYKNSGGPQFLREYPADPKLYTGDDLCRNYDYPSKELLKAYMDVDEVNLAIVTPLPNAGQTAEDYDQTEKMVRVWRDLNDNFFKNTPDMYQYMNSDSSNVVDAILGIAREFTNYKCKASTTTTTTTSQNESTPPPTSTVTPTGLTEITRPATEATSHNTGPTNSTEPHQSDTSDCVPAPPAPTGSCVPNSCSCVVPPCACVPNCGPLQQGLQGSADDKLLIRVKEKPKKLSLNYEA